MQVVLVDIVRLPSQDRGLAGTRSIAMETARQSYRFPELPRRVAGGRDAGQFLPALLERPARAAGDGKAAARLRH